MHFKGAMKQYETQICPRGKCLEDDADDDDEVSRHSVTRCLRRNVRARQADVRPNAYVLRLSDGELDGAGRRRRRPRLHGWLRRRSAGRQLALC